MENLSVGGGQSAAQVTSTVNAAITAQVATANAAAVKTAINAAGSAPIFAARAWVLTNSANEILGGGNISAIADLGVGAWRADYTTAVPSNCSPQFTPMLSGGTGNIVSVIGDSLTTSCSFFINLRSSGAAYEAGMLASLTVVG